MADPIVVSVEIKDSDYVKEFEVDPAEPLVKLLQRVAKEEEIPLRKKSGHPLVWTAEGPDIREDHAGEWADLTRTQPLTRISKVVLERYGERAPLFTVRFTIPGAAEALEEKAEVAKRAEIEARMAQRAAERQAEKSAAIGDAEDEFVMDYAAPASEAPTFTPEPATVQDPNAGRGMGGAAAAAAGVAAGAVAVGAMAAAAGAQAAGGVESRIRRRSGGSGGGGGGGAARSAATSTGSAKARGGKGGAAKGGGRGKATKTGKNKAVSTGSAKARGAKGKKGGKGSKGGSDLPPWAIPAAAGGGFLLLVGILAMVFSGGEPEPEPTPEPTPPPEIVDIEVATPPPPPPKPEPEEEVTPPPMEQFYSRGKIVDYQAKEVSAQLTSFTKTNVRIVYNALHPNAGQSHTIALEGRFKVKISNGGGNMNGKAFTAGVTPGKASRVDLRYDGSRLTVRVGGRRAGSWSVPDSGGFPRWRLTMDSGTELSGLRASAQVEE